MKNILIVDDNHDNLALFEAYLEEDYEVTLAESANLAMKEIERKVPDIAILDIRMPDIDGFDLLSLIREHESAKDVPILLLSAEGQLMNNESAQRMGAQAYAHKPILKEDLIDIVEKLTS